MLAEVKDVKIALLKKIALLSIVKFSRQRNNDAWSVQFFNFVEYL